MKQGATNRTLIQNSSTNFRHESYVSECKKFPDIFALKLGKNLEKSIFFWVDAPELFLQLSSLFFRLFSTGPNAPLGQWTLVFFLNF